MRYIFVSSKGYNCPVSSGKQWPNLIRRISGVIWVKSIKNGLWMPHDLYVQDVSDADQVGLDFVFQTLKDFRQIGPAIDRIYMHDWGPDYLVCMQYIEASLRRRKEAREEIYYGRWDRIWDEICYSVEPR